MHTDGMANLNEATIEMLPVPERGNKVHYFAGFFFQAKDGIRDTSVTGVQTCALPIWPRASTPRPRSNSTWSLFKKAIGPCDEAGVHKGARGGSQIRETKTDVILGRLGARTGTPVPRGVGTDGLSSPWRCGGGVRPPPFPSAPSSAGLGRTG